VFSLLTPKAALVPAAFFEPSAARETLSETVELSKEDKVEYISISEYAAVLVYSLSVDNAMTRNISGYVDEDQGRVLPELYFILKDLRKLPEYNKVVASYAYGYLHLGIAQGNNLLLANIFKADDFTCAEYFIFLSLKKLQFNPEVTKICFRTPLSEEEKMSLYRYFNSVEQL